MAAGRMFWAAAGLIALFLLAIAALLPGDASFDLANYHLYGPFALLHGKWDRDLAPAQLQTYLPPLADIPYYLLSRHLPSVRLLNIAASIPAVVAATLVLRITLHLLPPPHDAWRTALAAIAVLFGVTGAATLPVLGTSMSDMIPVSFVLAGLLVLVRNAEALAGWAPALASGVLVGTGMALKLTLAYAGAGIVLGLLAWSGPRPVHRLRAALLFGTAAAVALVVVDGWWWIRLWRWSGNPVFPMYNDIFRSPLVPPTDFIDRRLLPHGWREAVLYPFLWAFDATPRVTEPEDTMRDPRIACALIASLALLPRRWPAGGRVRFLAVLFLAGFVLWEKQFSIFRYLSLLELLSGTMLAVLAASIFPGPRAAPALVAGATLALLLALKVEIMPGWGRGPRGDEPPLVVDMRPLDRRALVLLLDPAPLAFLATTTDPAVRFIGTNNNLTRPEVPGLMQSRIRAAIGEQLRGDGKDDLWGLEMPDARFGHPDQALAAYRLHRTACFPVRTNIILEPIRLCRLASG